MSKTKTRKRITPRNIKRMLQLQTDGLSVAQIAKKMKRGPGVIYAALRRNVPSRHIEKEHPEDKTLRQEMQQGFAVVHEIAGGQAKVCFHDAESAFKYFQSVRGAVTLQAFSDGED